MTIVYFASDHAGFELKNQLASFVKDLGHDVEDCGPSTLDLNDDYPPLIARAARKLSEDVGRGKDNRAIVIGASGQGEAVVANRFKGVRCGLYYGSTTRMFQTDVSGKTLNIISSLREHNDANCLSLGARFLTVDEAKQAVKEWLDTKFSREERHVRRIHQIDEL